jgi:hypothetical protein
MINDIPGDRLPAPIVAISAVSVFTGSVEIQLAVFFRNTHDVIRFTVRPRFDVSFAALRQGAKKV